MDIREPRFLPECRVTHRGTVCEVAMTRYVAGSICIMLYEADTGDVWTKATTVGPHADRLARDEV